MCIRDRGHPVGQALATGVAQPVTRLGAHQRVGGQAAGRHGGQEVYHLHLHLLGGRRMGRMAVSYTHLNVVGAAVGHKMARGEQNVGRRDVARDDDRAAFGALTCLLYTSRCV